MKILEKIQNIIKQEKRNIIFYFDADGSLKDEQLELEGSEVKWVEVKNNYFELKYRLEFEWKNQAVFLYHEFSKPNDLEIRQYPLLDLLKANVELRLDATSELMSEYRLQSYHLPLVKRYIDQLKSKTNQKKLARILEPDSFTENALKLGLISIALDFNTVVDKNTCIAKWLGTALHETLFNKVCKTLLEWDLVNDLLLWLEQLFGIKSSELSIDYAKDIASKIKYNILAKYIEKPTKNDTYAKLKIDRTIDLNKVNTFYQDWSKEASVKSFLAPVFNQLAVEIHDILILEWYGMEQSFGYYSSEMMDNILKNLYEGVSQNYKYVQDEAFKWMRSEELLQQEHLKNSMVFLYHVANMYAILDNYKSYRFNNADDYVKVYSEELYKVDYNFRKAIIFFEKIKDQLYEFENIAREVFEYLNQKYERFLIELNVEWQKVLSENDFNFDQMSVAKQFDFYEKNLLNFEYKIVVIISDALRYELGHEVYNNLLNDSKNNLTIEPYLASIPSYTNLGMSNLLPNKGMTVEKGEADLVFKINDKTTTSSNRATILQSIEPTSTTINYTELRRMTKEEKRRLFREHRITYIYHDWIDAIGDKKRTEHETFEATNKAVDDIKWMVNNVTGELGISHLLVTSDHGFLFNYNELNENSRENLPKSSTYKQEHSRFVVADEFEGNVNGYTLNLSDTTKLKTDLKITIPRAINRYRKQGNIGVQFVHGGASLQELIVPVIKFYKHKKEVSQTVTFKRIDQNNKIASGNIKITLLQDQPVSNEYKKIDLIAALYSDVGVLFSNEVVIHLNATSNNPKERIHETILTLNSLGSKANFCYLKLYDKNDKTRLNPMGSSDLITISSLMEKDDF